jgi:hypothetical protein
MTLRRILELAVVFAALNLAWETAQLPLYTIWVTDPWPRVAFAVVHCTGGDLLIGAGSLLAALSIVGRGWPNGRSTRVRAILLTTVFGLGYTIFSEWLNVVVRETWAYTQRMPTLPPLGTGLSPLLQWLLLPGVALELVARRASKASSLRKVTRTA